MDNYEDDKAGQLFWQPPISTRSLPLDVLSNLLAALTSVASIFITTPQSLELLGTSVKETCHRLLVLTVPTSLCVTALPPWQRRGNLNKSFSMASSQGVIYWPPFEYRQMIAIFIVLSSMYVVD